MTALKIIVGIVVVLVLGTQIKSCTDCWSEGGTPVKGVITYACIKNK